MEDADVETTEERASAGKPVMGVTVADKSVMKDAAADNEPAMMDAVADVESVMMDALADVEPVETNATTDIEPVMMYADDGITEGAAADEPDEGAAVGVETTEASTGSETSETAADGETTKAIEGENPMIRGTASDNETNDEGTTRGLGSTRAVTTAGPEAEWGSSSPTLSERHEGGGSFSPTPRERYDGGGSSSLTPMERHK